MDFLPNFLFPPKSKKTAQYSRDHQKYKKAVQKNPRDPALKAQFIKFCVGNHFLLQDAPKAHMSEALSLYKDWMKEDFFDPQVHYMIGRYYQDKDQLKSQNAYLSGIRHFNRQVERNPGSKSEHADVVYALALNFLTMQFGQIHPDLDKFFRTMRKNYPLLNKRVELENELQKPSPNQTRIKQLTQELRELREITGKKKK
jgi:hypothetical protein